MSLVSANEKVAIVVGRFQPLHDGHMALINKAAEIADKVCVVIGSANKSRTYENPWTAKERLAMVLGAVGEAGTDLLNKIEIAFANDLESDVEWMSSIYGGLTDLGVRNCTVVIGDKDAKESWPAALVNMFGGNGSVITLSLGEVSATSIRERYFEEDPSDCSHHDIKSCPSEGCPDCDQVSSELLAKFAVPSNVRNFLANFSEGCDFCDLYTPVVEAPGVSKEALQEMGMNQSNTECIFPGFPNGAPDAIKELAGLVESTKKVLEILEGALAVMNGGLPCA